MPLPSQLSDLSYLIGAAPYGFDWVNDTTVKTGKWFAIVAIADGTTLASLVGNKVPGVVTGLPLPVGLPLTGDFTQFSLQAGQVIAYRYQ